MHGDVGGQDQWHYGPEVLSQGKLLSFWWGCEQNTFGNAFGYVEQYDVCISDSSVEDWRVLTSVFPKYGGDRA